MKNKHIFLFSSLLIFSTIGCVREEFDDLPRARYSRTADIFTDNFVGLGSDFYFPYQGAKPDVFSVDDNESYEGTSSIRIDVPDADDPGGNFAGAIFRIDGAGRDLQDFNALTFYARASQAATISEIGFGQDFLGDTYRAFRTDVKFTTNWQKFVIPIPDPSKLLEERGVFQFAAGGIGPEGEEVGFSFWIDELRFENLSSLAQPLPKINNGENQEVNSFSGVTFPVTGTSVTLNFDGLDISVVASPAYFNFTSSNPSVATVNNQGQVSVIGAGNSTITASLGSDATEIDALGSLTVNSPGQFIGAPTPPARNAEDVVSIFSDAYTNVQVDNYNGFFQFATTQGGLTNIAGENIISYTNLNFVSVNMFNSPDVNASEMTHLHLDINVRENVDPGDFIRVQIINNNGPTETSGAVNLGNYKPLVSEEWISYDIPMSDFGGLGTANDVDLIFFISDGTVSDIFVDNIYFYR
ncbi:Ig-like domain-containing protein [Algoriphagus kandeliae]|nr:Ig-like domain-containing protein [Algoriphagus kandeliae]